jgi:anti-anti-sigma factor
VKPNHLRIDITNEAECTRVSLCGELDLGSVPVFEMDTASLHTRPDAPPLVLIDLGELTFCDSAGLRGLLTVSRALEQRETNVRLVRVPHNVRRVLEITGTLSVFDVDPG